MEDMIWESFSHQIRDKIGWHIKEKTHKARGGKDFLVLESLDQIFMTLKNMIIFDLMAVFVDLIWSHIYEQTFPNIDIYAAATKEP